MTLQQHKCKNTVFGIVFFLFFFLGAICGVFLFRCLQRSDSAWLAAYCAALSGAGNLSGGALLLLLLRPVAVVLAVGMFPFGHRLLPLLIFLRGCLMASRHALSVGCRPNLWYFAVSFYCRFFIFSAAGSIPCTKPRAPAPDPHSGGNCTHKRIRLWLRF